MQGIARDDVDDRRLEILHELDLALAVPGSRRNDEAADLLGPVVEAQAPGEEAVGHHVLEDVVLPHARHEHAPGHEVRRATQVTCRVEDDRRPARRARRGVHADEFLLGTAKNP